VIHREMIETMIGSTKVPTVLACATALLLAAGAWSAPGSTPAASGAEPEVQRVEIEATARGYVPAEVELVAGAPAELVFTRRTGSGCASQVHIPELGVEMTRLPQGEPVTVRIPGAEPGSYEFLCGMNMLRGTIRVTGSP
jgi:plastocyanin domain-containing protein